MWKQVTILLFVTLFNIINSQLEVGDTCKLSDGKDGICAITTNCAEAVRQIQTSKHHDFRRCAFDDLEEVICCPPKPNLPIETDKRFGAGERVAERECRKVVESFAPILRDHIIGGTVAGDGEFPHMVALGFRQEGKGYSFDCGGTLISANFVLTAAHCANTILGIKPSIVRAGVKDIRGPDLNNETDHVIQEIITYPDYTRTLKYNDLALLRLEHPVTFSDSLLPACLYTNVEDPKGQMTITGYGQVSIQTAKTSNVLLKAQVSAVPIEECTKSYGSWRKLPQGIINTQLCAGNPTGKTDTCQGDSGGPIQGLTADDGLYRLIGVTSFGKSCGNTVPGVYTRVARYLDWIESVVWP